VVVGVLLGSGVCGTSAGVPAKAGSVGPATSVATAALLGSAGCRTTGGVAGCARQAESSPAVRARSTRILLIDRRDILNPFCLRKSLPGGRLPWLSIGACRVGWRYSLLPPLSLEVLDSFGVLDSEVASLAGEGLSSSPDLAPDVVRPAPDGERWSVA